MQVQKHPTDDVSIKGRFDCYHSSLVNYLFQQAVCVTNLMWEKYVNLFQSSVKFYGNFLVWQAPGKTVSAIK